jgi:hypothetical protein
MIMYQEKKPIRWDAFLNEVKAIAYKDPRNDEQDAVFVRNLVQQTIKELFRHEYGERKWLNDGLIHIATNVNEGATEYGYQELGQVGEADFVSEAATDLPTADIFGDYTVHTIHTLGTSFRYTTQEVRKARLQGTFDIVSEKSTSAREAYDRKLNEVLERGEATKGLQGITTAQNIRVDTVTTGNWAAGGTTGAQIVADLATVLGAIKTATDDVERPNTLVLPGAIMLRLETSQFSTASDITILDYLKKAFKQIDRWEEVQTLSTASAAGGNAGMLYNRDKSKIRAILPMPLSPLAPEPEGLTVVVNLESRFGGIMVPKPRGISRLEGI